MLQISEIIIVDEQTADVREQNNTQYTPMCIQFSNFKSERGANSRGELN